MITISIVSHNQGDLLARIFNDFIRLCSEMSIEIILTKNVPEVFTFSIAASRFPVTVIENCQPKGFGANHNFAFQHAKGQWFCVVNPDICLLENPFLTLIEEIEARSAVVIAPMVLNCERQVEDSIRRFPTPFSVIARLVGSSNDKYQIVPGDESFAAEWVGGMFMLFRAADYKSLGGFDENFFLYYEDVDICTRLWKAGQPVLACPKAQVIHEARRTSHKNLRFMMWHLASMARYFWKHWCRLPKISES